MTNDRYDDGRYQGSRQQSTDRQRQYDDRQRQIEDRRRQLDDRQRQLDQDRRQLENDQRDWMTTINRAVVSGRGDMALTDDSPG
jgi:predicted  nucleic acid-binding Zn-ribbon protein